MNSINRRHFISHCLAVASTATIVGKQSAYAQESAAMPPLCIFSKHLQFLDYKSLATTCKESGLDGIDLTVRPGGHVNPERVTTELPEAVQTIRSEGLEVPMITTRFMGGSDVNLRDVLGTAKQCGIPYFRIGNHQYDVDKAVLEEISTFTEDVRGLVRVAEELGLTAGYHNHSGKNNFGAPLWDLHRMYETIGSKNLGSNFDVGHAVVEGAYGDWEITARLLSPWVRMVAVKDFVFEGSHPAWKPLGEGIVDTAAFLRIFREQAAFSGPISLHFEYKVRNDEQMIEEVARAVKYMRNEVFPKAGYGKLGP